MAKSLESPTKLTEFAPLSAETQSNNPSIRSTFARWFGINNKQNNNPPTIKEGTVTGAVESTQTTGPEPARDDVSQSGESTVSSNLAYSEGRNLVSVLTRVSNLLAQKGMYSEAELKQYWMPDSVSNECYECNTKFTALRRKHHCRICGQIFCSRCCHQQVPGKLMGYSGDLRACTYCCQIVLSCLQSIDPASDASLSDLTRIQEDLAKKLASLQPPSASSTSSSEGAVQSGSSSESKGRNLTLKRKASVSFQEERFAPGMGQLQTLSSAERRVLVHDSVQLKALHEEMMHPLHGIHLQNHRHKLRSMVSCCSGNEVVDWLLVQDKASSRVQATAIGQALIDAAFLECISSSEQIFVDGYSLYRPKGIDGAQLPVTADQTSKEEERANEVQEPEDDAQEPLWVRQIGLQEDGSGGSGIWNRPGGEEESSSTGRLMKLEDLDKPGDRLLLPQRRGDEFSLSSEMNLNPSSLLSPTMPQSEAFPLQQPTSQESRLMAELFDEHTQRLMKQLLSWQGLSLSWADVLLPLVASLAHTVRPDVRDDDDDMDIRHYVHLKKVPGGTKSDSKIVHGVVCSKNVANRTMSRKSENPNIMLLSSAIDYQRKESKLIALEPLMMQENEYLKNAVAKIATFNPEVLLVEKVVSGVAQEFLSNLAITLVLNVKPAVMDRVARCCQADIVPSIDAHQLSRPKLGSCLLFHVETIPLDRPNSSKTFMFFDGCPPRLGATVLLRGAGYHELRKVKKIFRFMIFACYNARLERSFLNDEFAIPKMLGSSCADGSSCSSSSSGCSNAGGAELQDALNSAPPPGAHSSPLQAGGTTTQSSFSTSSLVIIDSESLMNANDSLPMEPVVSASGNPSDSTDLKPVRELDDPLHEYLRSRQQGLLYGDQSLGSTPVQDQTNNSSRMYSQTLATNSMLFRKAMEDTILSISPLLRHSLPYLETEAGRNAPLRKYLPEVLYYSQQLKQCESPPRKIRYGDDGTYGDTPGPSETLNDRNTLHPFLRVSITPSMSKTELLGLLSDFRARGVRPSHYSKPSEPAANKNKLSITCSDDWENLSTGDDQDGKQKDCLDPFNLQKLCVLFSSYCPNSISAPNHCVSPWVVEMEFYGRNDISLGGFLERYCFQANYACPSSACQSPSAAHVRRFVHDTSSILVIIRQLANPVNCNASANSNSGDDRSILMWSWCKKCKQVSPIATMSSETWHFSFAKYLELRLYGQAYCRRQIGGHQRDSGAPACACPHPLHTEHFHYFGCRNLVASFKYASIVLKEVVLAQPAIAISPEPNLLPRLIEDIRTVAQVGHGLYASISEWLKALTVESAGSRIEPNLSTLIEHQVQERLSFRKAVEEVQLLLTSPNLQQCNSPGSGEESLWYIMDREVLLKRTIAESVSSWNSILQDLIAVKKKEEKSSASKPSQRSGHPSDADMAEVRIVKDPPPMFTISPNSSREDSSSHVGGGELSRRLSDQSQHSSPSLSNSPNTANKSPFLRNRSSSDFPILANVSPSTDPMAVDQGGIGRRRSVGSNNEAVAGNEEGKLALEKLPATPSQSRLSLSALLAMTGPGPAVITSPFPSTEHHLLPPGAAIPLVVYQNEPSSIIAYALASLDYESQLADLQADLADQAVPSSPPRTSSPVGPDRWFDNVEREEPTGKGSGGPGLATGAASSSSTASVQAAAGPPPSNQHLEIQFSDHSTKFYCRIYYAEQFRQLRTKVFPAGEERFIRSLARCAPWAASGGKSGSTFCKTLDDRFVLKQMSKMEIQSFVDLAPNYINFTQRAQRENRPTAFCKIVGAFRIVFKNATTNAASKQDLLVMENLFYNRKVTRKYDLKGSERNRLVSASEAVVGDCVLLDENFLKMIWENPLYIRGYSQGVLSKALNADTQFLASQLVMDYSLLVGIDDETNQLIVGLIDYIRTFTWDKRLETFVKSSGILGGQGKMPTVVSPELYRTRFCEAMNRYFTAVPSFWD